MRPGIRPEARTARIIAAIGLGINTSRRLAGAFDTTVANISPELDRLSHMGVIVRERSAPSRCGRPCNVWRAA